VKVLVLGATGLLGHTVFRTLAGTDGWTVAGTVRSTAARERLPAPLREAAIVTGDLDSVGRLRTLLAEQRPEAVINCLSLPKAEMRADNYERIVQGLALLPRRLAQLCAAAGARLVHMSTDCVFSGAAGNYAESDVADATDAYGVAKFLGEPPGLHVVTLRTSIIGPELGTRNSLLEWFLAQGERCTGFARATFSGMPTVELARVMRDHILQRPELHGTYHVPAAPISKLDLLRLIANEYEKPIAIEADDQYVIDRSLDGRRFEQATGYRAPSWPTLLAEMHRDHRHLLALTPDRLPSPHAST
jgi:dTDP-4-dehydrorhamnose reductase